MEHSAGILLYRLRNGRVEVLLVHPGGPFWARKDEGAWSVPKGLYDPEVEDALAAARREFAEETGGAAEGDGVDLGEARQPSGKRVRAFAMEGDFDPATLRSNTFSMEWPPHAGTESQFPEVDRAGWFDLESARRKLLPGQVPFLDRLEGRLSEEGWPVGTPRP
jgi:predicted NUDIX family NTP pyrophosphohydrolase